MTCAGLSGACSWDDAGGADGGGLGWCGGVGLGGAGWGRGGWVAVAAEARPPVAEAERSRLWGGSGAAGAGRLFPGKKRGGGATDWESLLTFAVFPRGGGGDVRGDAGLCMFT